MKSFTVFLFIFVLKIDKFSVAQNTTDAATIVESTLNTPALLINPTSISSQNVTDDHFEVSEIEIRRNKCVFFGVKFNAFSFIWIIILFL